MIGSVETCAATRERRGAPRAAVMLAAAVEHAGLLARVRLVNLSETGSSIAGALPAKHCSVTLYRNGIALRGRIAWTDGGRGGVDFVEAVNPRELLRPIRARSAVPRSGTRRPLLRNAPPSSAERESMERCANLLGISLAEPIL